MLGAAASPARSLATSALTVTLGLTLLAGCGGDEDEKEARPTPTPSATPTPTPSPTATVDPRDVRPEPPVARNTPAGRTAYARFVIDRWSYALRTNDATAVSDLGVKKACAGCRELQAELARRTRQGWHVDFPGAQVNSTRLRTEDKEGKVYVATSQVDLPPSRSYYDDGSFRNENRGHEDRTFTVRMRFAKKKFVLLEFRLR